jgi:hypothetical protein
MEKSFFSLVHKPFHVHDGFMAVCIRHHPPFDRVLGFIRFCEDVRVLWRRIDAVSLSFVESLTNAVYLLCRVRRIAVAASYCRDEALSQWTRLIEKPQSWTAYEKVLRDMIQDPANRMGSALLSLKRVQQRDGQTIRELASYIEELEEDVPELSIEQQRAWTLLNALQPDLRAAVLREERVIRTRGQVISTAQRLRELGVVASESQPKRKRADSEIHGAREHEKRAESRGAEARVESRESRTVRGRTCFTCGKEGHVARDCPERKR